MIVNTHPAPRHASPVSRCIVLILLMAASRVGAAPDTVDERVDWPLWELGLFTGLARLPHYRGSDEYKQYVLPVPYVIYRGKLLRVGRAGVEGIFWESDRIETGLSFGGNPPVSRNNKAREDMPDLEAIAEGGGMMQFYFTDRQSPNPLYVSASLRAAISIEPRHFDVAYRGLRGGLQVVYRNRTSLKKQGISFGLNCGIIFSNRDYHRYFYDVDEAFATPTRPAYRAKGGYAGFHASANIMKEISERWAIAGFYLCDQLSGAAFEDSPLVKKKQHHIYGFAIIWTLRESEQRVLRSEGF